MRKLWITRLAIAVLAGFSASVVIGQAPAHAGIDCGTGPGNWFAGLNAYHLDGDSGFTYEGASANIAIRHGVLCDSGVHANTFNTAWSMLSDGNNQQYAQIGYFRYWNQCSYFFDEWKVNGQQFNRELRYDYGCLNENGAANQYWVQYYNGSLRLNVDVTVMRVTPFNPYSIFAYPFHPLFNGEVDYTGSNVPGLFGTPVSFSAVQLQKGSDDSWTTNLGTMSQGFPVAPRSNQTGVFNDAFSIWSS